MLPLKLLKQEEGGVGNTRVRVGSCWAAGEVDPNCQVQLSLFGVESESI